MRIYCNEVVQYIEFNTHYGDPVRIPTIVNKPDND